ncbi:signal peptidase I [Streptomyces radicis]|uniref:Signal peptidase I n=1 Tax=Streptomyces radicis TaxID=1750517 RepID=A0A3A9W110_9ACTN|nr:signal peptidase I [Streptomyces radicis]RKN06660.1 signal peptidase I [Streptomyces radicis]RKN19285.1 signal peptidase I [Streptomyces radicis]
MTESDAQPQERDRPARPQKGWRRWSRSVRLWVVVALSTVVLTMLTNAFVMQPFLIPSGSMEGTLQVGDRVVVNKLAYRFGGEIERGDVIVFDGAGSFTAEQSDPGLLGGLLRTAGAAVGLSPSSDTDYVKRVIGVGGDRVRCCDSQGRIEVNGEPLDEPYLYPGDKPSNVTFDIRVPEGRLWVMGDHRSDSADSREYLGSPGGGTVPVDRVIGRVELIGWPVDRWGWLRSAHG